VWYNIRFGRLSIKSSLGVSISHSLLYFTQNSFAAAPFRFKMMPAIFASPVSISNHQITQVVAQTPQARHDQTQTHVQTSAPSSSSLSPSEQSTVSSSSGVCTTPQEVNVTDIRTVNRYWDEYGSIIDFNENAREQSVAVSS
jgi:hypothetical protein